MLSRRTMMAAAPMVAAAAAAPGLGGSAVAQGATVGPAPGFYRYKVGDIEVTAIHDGFANRPLDGLVRNADLADVKKAMAAEYLPADVLPITFTTLVLRTGGKTVVIDTGNGDVGAPTSGRWATNFRAAGFDPAQVDTVVISHFHGDHISGLRLKSGEAVFSKAEVMVPEAEWAFWMDESKVAASPDGVKANAVNVRRVFGPMKDVTRYQAGKEIVPGLTTVAAAGHTPGHTTYMLSSGSSSLMIVSDITNHPALFVRNPTWAAVFDMDAGMARDTRIRMLDMAAAERAQLSFYHAPFPATGHIAKGTDGFRFVPAQWGNTG